MPLPPGTTQLTTANTNRDGTGTLVDLVTGDNFGTIPVSVAAKAVGATTAGMLRFFYYDGTNTRLIGELAVAAVPTPGATVKTWEDTTTFSGLMLQKGDKIKGSTHNAETFNVFPTAQDL